VSALDQIRSFFEPVLFDERDKAVPLVWVGDEFHAACMNPHTTRVFATMWNDGLDAKYYPTIYVSIWDAVRLLMREQFVSVRLSPFPRVALELIRDKCNSMEEAQQRLVDDLKMFHVL
jgi:hypothetical protein